MKSRKKTRLPVGQVTNETQTILPNGKASRDISDTTLRDFTGYTVRRVAGIVQSDVNRALKPLGLRLLSFSVLVMIVDNPGLRQAHLAEALSVERPNLVAIVDELQRAGWITRNPDPTDRRAHALCPTQAGQNLYNKAVEVVQSHEARMTGEMGGDERAVLLTMLRRIEAAGKSSA
ncbi:MAG: MarR family transcriptional regulator [Rhodobacteraceae bacterium]|nr:MarR family transcriptional regulator [Paracoccaceae bacterium]